MLRSIEIRMCSAGTPLAANSFAVEVIMISGPQTNTLPLVVSKSILLMSVVTSPTLPVHDDGASRHRVASGQLVTVGCVAARECLVVECGRDRASLLRFTFP